MSPGQFRITLEIVSVRPQHPGADQKGENQIDEKRCLLSSIFLAILLLATPGRSAIITHTYTARPTPDILLNFLGAISNTSLTSKRISSPSPRPGSLLTPTTMRAWIGLFAGKCSPSMSELAFGPFSFPLWQICRITRPALVPGMSCPTSSMAH